jgi:hypothetical protein
VLASGGPMVKKVETVEEKLVFRPDMQYLSRGTAPMVSTRRGTAATALMV